MSSLVPFLASHSLAVVLVGLIGMHKTGCSGETRLVLHVPSSSRAGKRFNYYYYYYYYYYSLAELTFTVDESCQSRDLVCHVGGASKAIQEQLSDSSVTKGSQVG
jgi:hypothetical protein